MNKFVVLGVFLGTILGNVIMDLGRWITHRKISPATWNAVYNRLMEDSVFRGEWNKTINEEDPFGVGFRAGIWTIMLYIATEADKTNEFCKIFSENVKKSFTENEEKNI